METVFLEKITPVFDTAALAAHLHVPDESEDRAHLARMVDEARGLARPRAVFGTAFVNGRDGDRTTLEQTVFTSRIVSVNLKDAGKAVPYIATCGPELNTWAAGISDILYSYWADAIKEAALRSAVTAVDEAIHTHTGWKKSSSMNPGSLADWPLEQQRELFALFGSAADRIGVTLTESCLMLPNKSVSGIRFATERDFVSCQLCPRENCPGRRAPYEPDMAGQRYRL